MNLIIDALDSNDRLSLISFSIKAETLSELKYMNDNEKKRQKGIVDNLKAFWSTFFKEPIRQFLNGIEKSYSPNNGRVQSVLFITDGESFDGTPKSNFLKLYGESKNYDFTVHTFLIGNEGKAQNLMEFANCRDGSFYHINDLEKNEQLCLKYNWWIKNNILLI